MAIERRLNSVWKSRNLIALILWPISLIYCALVELRRFAYACQLIRVVRFKQPIIVVGNITVGGTGKTPFTIWLANYLKEMGFKPGIVSRGYGRVDKSPRLVKPDSDPDSVGDEPLLISRRTNLPVAVAPRRAQAVQLLLSNSDSNIFISDDGLQHLGLASDLKFALIDGEERFGNLFCLPAGPLRESTRRLQHVDFKVVKGQGSGDEYSMNFKVENVVNIKNPHHSKSLESFSHEKVTAITGIRNPETFHTMLRNAGIEFDHVEFPDHHRYTEEDFRKIASEKSVILMTEKDAVKCEEFALTNWWYVVIDIEIDKEIEARIAKKLSAITTRNLDS